MKLLTALLCLLSALTTTAPPAAEERVHCNLAVLSKAERARDAQLVPALREALLERKELADGYAYRFQPGTLKDLGEWLAIVAKCCQPLSYAVSLEPQPGGALWVRITGHDAKEFIDLEFSPLMQKQAPHGASE
ncbi:MAG TPA: hypothetical protein VK454_12740 [Myxococcaceae bacterium]|nr:hypothetical protein [Myxococcaceae bacterium]